MALWRPVAHSRTTFASNADSGRTCRLNIRPRDRPSVYGDLSSHIGDVRCRVSIARLLDHKREHALERV